MIYLCHIDIYMSDTSLYCSYIDGTFLVLYCHRIRLFTLNYQIIDMYCFDILCVTGLRTVFMYTIDIREQYYTHPTKLYQTNNNNKSNTTMSSTTVYNADLPLPSQTVTEDKDFEMDHSQTSQSVDLELNSSDKSNHKALRYGQRITCNANPECVSTSSLAIAARSSHNFARTWERARKRSQENARHQMLAAFPAVSDSFSFEINQDVEKAYHNTRAARMNSSFGLPRPNKKYATVKAANPMFKDKRSRACLQQGYQANCTRKTRCGRLWHLFACLLPRASIQTRE